MHTINTKLYYVVIFFTFITTLLGAQIKLFAQSPEEILKEFRKYTIKDYDYKTIYYKQLELYDDESKEIISGFYEEMASSSYMSLDKLLEFTDAFMRNASIPDIKNINSLLDFQKSGCGVSDYESVSDDYGNLYVIRESVLFDPEKFFNCVFDFAGTGDNIGEVARALTAEFETLSQTFNFYRDGRYYQTTQFVKTSNGWKISLTYQQKLMYGVDYEDEENYDYGNNEYNEEENYQEFENENTTKDDEPSKYLVDLSINNAEISESVDSDLNNCFTALKIKLNYTASLFENSKFTQYPKSLKIPYVVYLRPIDQSTFQAFYNSEAILRNGVPNSEMILTLGEPNFRIPDNNYEIFIEFMSPYDKSSIVRMQRNDFPFFRKVCFEMEKHNSENKNQDSDTQKEKEIEPVIDETEKNFQEALTSMSEKDYVVALSKFKKVYNGNSKSALKKTALISMAACSYQLKKYDDADTYLEEFKSMGFLNNDNDRRYTALKALTSFRKKKPDYMQGLSHAGAYDINLFPEMYQKDILYYKAYALEKLKKTERAVEAYENYIAAYPKEGTAKFIKQLDELKYRLLIDKSPHLSYEDVYKRIDFKDEDQINKIIIYDIGTKLLFPINNNVNGVVIPILIKNANVGDKYKIYIEPLPIYSPVLVSRLLLEADIPRSKLHVKDFAINLSYTLLKKKTYADFIYYDHNLSSFINRIEMEKNKIEKKGTGQILLLNNDSFGNYYSELDIEVENLGHNLKKISEFGSKKESSDIYLTLIIMSSQLNAMKIINDAKEKARYIQLVGGLGIE